MILLTGSTGFIGKFLSNRIRSKDELVVAPVRYVPDVSSVGVSHIQIGDLLPDTDWSQALVGVDVVIHLAARVHIMGDDTLNPLAAFRMTNTQSTINLARQASIAGVQRFVFLSSIKVNGESTSTGQKFTAEDINVPVDPYGISKYEAEQGLRELALQTGMEVVIIRPPLVYGPGVKANFQSMIRLVHSGIPLPLGSIHNKRSFVAIDNLVDLIIKCIDHPAAVNQTFLVSDGEDLSTTSLLKRLGLAFDRRSLLIPVPHLIIDSALRLIGKGIFADRLCENLQIDIDKTRCMLDWKPCVTVDEALDHTVKAWLQENS